MLDVGSSFSVAELIAELTRRLQTLPDPGDEARETLAALLDVPRHWPALHGSERINTETWQLACAAADKRARGAPLAYCVGHANFRRLTLLVDERVLIPRSETEMLVDLVLDRTDALPAGIAIDVGTGSGAIAISLATEGAGRFQGVIATDVSSDALLVATENAARSSARIEFVNCSLLPPAAVVTGRPVAAVVSNPPYISFGEIAELPASVRDWEPPTALYSERDGLALTARLVRRAAQYLAPGGLLALEVDARRASLVAELVSSDGRYDDVSIRLDLAGRERFVLATRRSTKD
ncbi:MAG TPA: peptide chain release factor N(5)-glutamine methyltransferase [Gemmatimonadaceae bacterium]|nr:peptide chain release factor N(5)-glutamine methyltransferase [Gemmatimonadaceae bacterium]